MVSYGNLQRGGTRTNLHEAPAHAEREKRVFGSDGVARRFYGVVDAAAVGNLPCLVGNGACLGVERVRCAELQRLDSVSASALSLHYSPAADAPR